ncbi:uncharacterized protein TNCV_4341791 [Trichonephila clavipes]|nr:uncharacterized protein TNCV_4341791 [Trichonephila clavipes]
MTPVDLPYVPVLLNETFITALWDTGAEKSFILVEVYRKYLSYRPRQKTKDRVVTGQGAPCCHLGRDELQIRIREFQKTWEFHILNNMQYQCIFGIDFMKESKLTLDFDQKSLILPDNQIKHLQKMDKPFEIDLSDTKLDLRALDLNSHEQLIREQREDPELGHIYRYLENPDDGSVDATSVGGVRNNNLIIWKKGKRVTVNIDQVRVCRPRQSDTISSDSHLETLYEGQRSSNRSSRSQPGKFKGSRKASSEDSNGSNSNKGNAGWEDPKSKCKVESNGSGNRKDLKRSKVCRKRSLQGSEHRDHKRPTLEPKQGIKRAIPSLVSSRNYKHRRHNNPSQGSQSIAGPSHPRDSRQDKSPTEGSRHEGSGQYDKARETRTTKNETNRAAERRPVRSKQTTAVRRCPYYLRSQVRQPEGFTE